MSNLSVFRLAVLLVSGTMLADDGAALFQAVRQGDTGYLKSHISKDTLEVRDRRGASLLMHAAAFGNLEAIRLLLDAARGSA